MSLFDEKNLCYVQPTMSFCDEKIFVLSSPPYMSLCDERHNKDYSHHKVTWMVGWTKQRFSHHKVTWWARQNKDFSHHKVTWWAGQNKDFLNTK
jgi:hypothetical protein